MPISLIVCSFCVNRIVFVLIWLYLLTTFVEEYFHCITARILYPNSELYFYVRKYLYLNIPLFTQSFGVYCEGEMSERHRLFVSLLGPLNALLVNIFMALVFISFRLETVIIVMAIIIPLGSLFPIKHPLQSDGYKIISILKRGNVSAGYSSILEVFKLEKKIFLEIFSTSFKFNKVKWDHV